MARVHVIYHHFPHYRAPVLRALAQSVRHDYHFFGAHTAIDGIESFDGDEIARILPISIVQRQNGQLSLRNYKEIFQNRPDVLIVIGNPNYRETWLIAIKARFLGIKVIFWSHGWLRPEPFLKARLRNLYFLLAHRVMVYGSRARVLAKDSGFDAGRIDVIWNSLDWERQSEVFLAMANTPVADLRARLGLPAECLVITTISRLTKICNYDWLIDAVALLAQDYPKPIVIDMIGDGPESEHLLDYAESLGVNLKTNGAVYDETVIAQHLMASDMVVSPGKVGLTAMHALAYGVPTITHGDFYRQMPEVEAITSGVNGAFFEYGSVPSLLEAIKSLLNDTSDIAVRRERCRASLVGRFTPEAQESLISDTIDKVTHD